MSNWSRPGIGGMPTCCRKWPRAPPTALPARSLRTEVVRKLRGGKAVGGALGHFRQHVGIPPMPGRDQLLINPRLATLQVGALHGVLGHVEQERVIEDLEK